VATCGVASEFCPAHIGEAGWVSGAGVMMELVMRCHFLSPIWRLIYSDIYVAYMNVKRDMFMTQKGVGGFGMSLTLLSGLGRCFRGSKRLSDSC
jgi:hypothetical protein